MKQLSLRTGLLALLAFMTLLLLAVSFMGIVAINKGNRSLDVINRIQGIELNSLYQSNADLMRARANAALAVRKIEIGLLEEGAAVTKLSQADVVSSQQSLKRFVDAGTVTAHGKKLADAVSASYKAYLDQGIKPMMNALDKQYTDEYYQLLEGNLATLAASYNKAVTDFSQLADQITQAQLAQAAYNETKMKILIAVAVVLTLLLLVLAWQLLRRMLLQPLNLAILHLEQVAAGDLSQALPPSGNNELGRLNHALAGMQQSLRTSVSQVREASMQIDIGSRELAAGNVNLSQRTEESAASLEQTAASMEQLTATVRLNASNAQQAPQLAHAVSATATRAAAVARYVMEKMHWSSGRGKWVGG
ncbi:MAG TPA: methyl-accepting chemotaxis protein, partial [Pantoea agglomerans]|nr:methyl-accepting chemotaxis protein [Pantoea agglomerans]